MGLWCNVIELQKVFEGAYANHYINMQKQNIKYFQGM
jgi:hypothetical protein